MILWELRDSKVEPKARPREDASKAQVFRLSNKTNSILATPILVSNAMLTTEAEQPPGAGYVWSLGVGLHTATSTKQNRRLVSRLLCIILWELRDSNPRPSACKADALNQLS